MRSEISQIRKQKLLLIACVGMVYSIHPVFSQKVIADHTIAREEVLRSIPHEYINKARSELVISFQHTSHGTHVSRGMYGLPDYKPGDDSLFAISRFNQEAGKLYFMDERMELYPPGAKDVSDYETTFVETTRNFLDAEENAQVNVVMWAWCDISDHQVGVYYLPGMETLISEYGPGGSKVGTGAGLRETPVTFVFMTGHATRNFNVGEGRPMNQAQLIIDHCIANGYLCLDYYSIDSHDMDDNYWEDAGDDGNSESYGGNFYQDYQDAHVVGDGYYENRSIPGGDVSMGSHTTQHITSNRKAYAMWWILARLAGWNGGDVYISDIEIATEGNVDQILSGEELQLTSTIIPEDASNQALKWSVINVDGSASIDSTGLLSGGQPGMVRVLALAQDGSGAGDTLNLTIVEPDVLLTNITIASTGGASELDEGSTLQFTASLMPENATNPTVLWSVVNGTGSASISESGLFTALTAGSVDVVASAQDASGISSTFGLTIVGASGQLNKKDANLVIYPNPNMGRVYVDPGGLQIERIELLSSTGSVIRVIAPDPGESLIELDLSDQQAGVFFLHAFSGDHSFVHRIIISE
jgi:hypothetical protein